MRILLHIIQYPPDVNSTGLLMSQLARGLAAAGHDLSILTTFPHYEKFRVWDQYRGKLFQRGTQDGLKVLRLWVYASGTKQNMKHRLLSYLSFNALAAAAQALARRRYDVVLCTNGSFFSGIATWLGSGLKGIPFVYNVQDLYPETFVNAGRLTSPRAISALTSMEHFMYRRAAHITVIAPSHRANLLAKGVPAAKLSLIPNFVDTEFIRPLPRANDFSTAQGLDGKFVVCHAGNLGMVYDLETMLAAAALLAGRPDILFLIVGDGIARPALEQQAAQLRLVNVRFLSFQPQAQLPALRAACDVAVSLYKHGSGHYSMPSKVYEIMASGRPLLAGADRGSDVAVLVADTGCGLCIEPGDPAALAAAITQLHDNPALCRQMGDRGRGHAVAHYSTNAAVERYETLLRQVTQNRRQQIHAIA